MNSKKKHRTIWIPDRPTEQCALLTTPLYGMNFRSTHWTICTIKNPTQHYELHSPHWTMWTLNNPTEQCELQTIPLKNVNSRPSHSRQPYEPCELQTIPFGNVNSRSAHCTMLNPDHPTTVVNSIPPPPTE